MYPFRIFPINIFHSLIEKSLIQLSFLIFNVNTVYVKMVWCMEIESALIIKVTYCSVVVS
jgi:hypothetical protein